MSASDEQISEQIAELQTKIAYQEDLIATLNDEVSLLQREIEALNLRWLETREQMQELREGAGAAGGEELPPPHY